MKKEATNITCPKCRKDTAIVSEVNDGKTHIVEVECECGYWDNEVIE
jgi:C4-type Zn-finger protein